MIVRSLTVLSVALLLLAMQAAVPAGAQETAPPVPAAPADVRTEAQEREAAEPAVSEPAAVEPSAVEPVPSDAEAAQPPPAASRSAAAPAPPGSRFRTMDRLELESTAITGNRELPKVLYIVPWKKADLGDLIGRPANSLLDEVLTPVDRDVFRRQTEYFSKLEAPAPAPAPGTGPQQPAQPQPEQKSPPAPAPR